MVKCLTCPGQGRDGAQRQGPVQTSREWRGGSPARGSEELLVCQLEDTGRCWDEERWRSSGRREANPSAIGKRSDQIPRKIPVNDTHDRQTFRIGKFQHLLPEFLIMYQGIPLGSAAYLTRFMHVGGYSTVPEPRQHHQGPPCQNTWQQ